MPNYGVWSGLVGFVKVSCFDRFLESLSLSFSRGSGGGKWERKNKRRMGREWESDGGGRLGNGFPSEERWDDWSLPEQP